MSRAVNIIGIKGGNKPRNLGWMISNRDIIVAFKKDAKSTYAGAKGKPTIPAVKKHLKMLGATEYYANWKPDSSSYKDDSVKIWYKDDVKKESVDLGENNWKKLNDTSNYFKMLAVKGMGTETNKSISKVGTELEYLDTKSGKKHKGVITKIDGKGYEVIKADNLEGALKLISAKKERFTFYNMDKADKIIGIDKDDRSK